MSENQANSNLGIAGSAKKINIAAWSLAAFVVLVGAIMLATTGNKIFILFIVLGVLTAVNVVLYDNFVLKPKVARLKAEAAKQQEQADESADKEAQQ